MLQNNRGGHPYEHPPLPSENVHFRVSREVFLRGSARRGVRPVEEVHAHVPVSVAVPVTGNETVSARVLPCGSTLFRFRYRSWRSLATSLARVVLAVESDAEARESAGILAHLLQHLVRVLLGRAPLQDSPSAVAPVLTRDVPSPHGIGEIPILIRHAPVNVADDDGSHLRLLCP